MDDELTVDSKFFDLYDSMIGDDVDMLSVLNHVAGVACRIAHSERATVYLIDRTSHELESAAVIGNVTRSIRIPISENHS